MSKDHDKEALNLRRKEVWQYNTLFGCVGMIRAQTSAVITNAYTTDQSKALACKIQELNAQLDVSLQTHKPWRNYK